MFTKLDDLEANAYLSHGLKNQHGVDLKISSIRWGDQQSENRKALDVYFIADPIPVEKPFLIIPDISFLDPTTGDHRSCLEKDVLDAAIAGFDIEIFNLLTR